MSGFSADWLALRARYDLAARNPSVLDAVMASIHGLSSVRVLDLACGSGSTMRALHTHFPARQHWDLVDNDPDLLALARTSDFGTGITLDAIRFDLDRNLDVVVDATVDLITTSALLDLVSKAWLDRFLREAAARSLPIYAALTYDGRTDLSPEDPLDEAVVSAVNAHQRTDKGFGPALGPSAAAAAIAGCELLDYSVVSGKSDWLIGPDDRAMQNKLLEGWARAAREIGTLTNSEVAAWLRRRTAALSEGLSSMRVGHVDFFAFPRSMR
jgi:SAM-dependent methyltransferase